MQVPKSIPLPEYAETSIPEKEQDSRQQTSGKLPAPGLAAGYEFGQEQHGNACTPDFLLAVASACGRHSLWS